ncbi:CPBP family intramembrane metalloprotease [Solibacillus sp. R5-41]|uniref:CPBP family intramembrane glutamic endopeptidase n=1 Tax=Solibacillus sp. R5-41 TaxID=2048654 RepID=UPI000C126429|nr:CPBP family intramembrane glutamic endopeptidase [Solibacillus sp. R5-41]ATP40974.1 CPBP family intramembrane metalloprotease [Solibacillus sp. R5-41]
MELLQLKQFKIRWFILYAIGIFIGIAILSTLFPYSPSKQEWITLFISICLMLYVLYQSNKHRFTYSEARVGEVMTGARWTKYLSLTACLQLAAYASGIAVLMFVFLRLENKIRDFFYNFLSSEEIAYVPLIVYILFFVNICILAPIWEELFFRGILLRRLTLKWSPQKSIIVSSLLFGLIHVNPITVLFAFFFGCVLGYAYLKTKSIIVPIVVHSFSNILGFLQFCWANKSSSELLPTTEGAQMILRISGITFVVVCLIALVIALKYFKNFRKLTFQSKYADVPFE